MIGHEIDMFELLIYRNTFSIEYSFISLISLACVCLSCG